MDLIGMPLVVLGGSVVMVNRWIYRRYFNEMKKLHIFDEIKAQILKDKGFLQNRTKIFKNKYLSLSLKHGDILKAELIDKPENFENSSQKILIDFAKVSSPFSSEFDFIKKRSGLREESRKEFSDFFHKFLFKDKQTKALVSIDAKKEGQLVVTLDDIISKNRQISDRFYEAEIDESELLNSFVFVWNSNIERIQVIENPSKEKFFSSMFISKILRQNIVKAPGIMQVVDVETLNGIDRNCEDLHVRVFF